MNSNGTSLLKLSTFIYFSFCMECPIQSRPPSNKTVIIYFISMEVTVRLPETCNGIDDMKLSQAFSLNNFLKISINVVRGGSNFNPCHSTKIGLICPSGLIRSFMVTFLLRIVRPFNTISALYHCVLLYGSII